MCVCVCIISYVVYAYIMLGRSDKRGAVVFLAYLNVMLGESITMQNYFINTTLVVRYTRNGDFGVIHAVPASLGIRCVI